MEFQGAYIREQGQTFAIVIVKHHVLQSSNTAEECRRQFERFFPACPIILMSQDSRGVPTYQGRRDIVNFLARLDLSQIPWKKYCYN